MSDEGLFSFLSDYIPSIMEGPEFPTYISIRPDWSSGGKTRGLESRTMTFERVKTIIYTSEDYAGMGIVAPKTKKTYRQYDKFHDTIDIGVGATPKYPRINESGRTVGRPANREEDRNFARRMMLYDAFGESQYDFEVRIGIMDPEANHIGYDGTPVSYEGLFKALGHLGYYPLAPLTDDNIMANLRRSLAAHIYSSIKGRGRHTSIAREVAAWARNIRDMVRDYLRGQNTIVPKDRLSPSTIYQRHSRQKNHGGLYKYGDANALWEAGTLESDISFEVIPIEGGRVRLTPTDRKRMKEAEEAKKRKSEANRRVSDRKSPQSRIVGKSAKPTYGLDNKNLNDADISLFKAASIIDRLGRKQKGLTYDQAFERANAKIKELKKSGIELPKVIAEYDAAFNRALEIAEAYHIDFKGMIWRLGGG